MTLERSVVLGAILLIVLGVLHAVHVGRSEDVEPYLWVASMFMVIQGLLTINFVRRAHHRTKKSDADAI